MKVCIMRYCCVHAQQRFPFVISQCAMMALRCLALLFTKLKKLDHPDNIPYILKVVPVSIWFLSLPN